MDQFYFVEGYIDLEYYTIEVDSGVINLSAGFTAVSDGDFVDSTGYYIPDYILDGYISVESTIVDFAASLVSLSSLTAITGELINSESQLTVTSEQSVFASAIRSTSVIFNTQSELNVLTGIIVDLNAQLDSVALLTANTGSIIDYNAELTSVFGQAVTANQIMGSTALLESDFDFAVQPGLFFSAAATLPLIALLYGDGVVININQYVYTIPFEHRTINIKVENRNIQVRR